MDPGTRLPPDLDLDPRLREVALKDQQRDIALVVVDGGEGLSAERGDRCVGGDEHIDLGGAAGRGKVQDEGHAWVWWTMGGVG